MSKVVNINEMKSYQKNKKWIYLKLPEMKVLDGLVEKMKNLGARTEVLEWLPYKDKKFPLHCITIGSEDVTSPCLLIVGGVHGLERIGTKVVNSFLTSTERLLSWDENFRKQFESHRVIFIPLLNPVGMYRLSRSNGNNVDLMRNSPVNSLEKAQFLYGGHRISPKLPFYRGEEGVLEIENQALEKVVRERVFPAKVSIALDVHSGFGSKDRLWFPYAKSKEPFPFLPEAHALSRLFNKTYQNNVYVVEPQAKQYTTHGDVWDYFLDEFLKTQDDKDERLFLPLTLEMGSWAWIRKNPLQILNPLGIFNPLRPHRRARMLRRHKLLMDFLRRAVASPAAWSKLNPEDRDKNYKKALKKWYEENIS